MPRTNVPVQILNEKVGEPIVFIPLDQANDHVIVNSGDVNILIQTAAAEGATVTIPSMACSHGRTADLGPFVIGAGVTQSYGPYEPALYGDGRNLFIDVSAMTGTPKIAAVRRG